MVSKIYGSLSKVKPQLCVWRLGIWETAPAIVID